MNGIDTKVRAALAEAAARQEPHDQAIAQALAAGRIAVLLYTAEWLRGVAVFDDLPAAQRLYYLCNADTANHGLFTHAEIRKPQEKQA